MSFSYYYRKRTNLYLLNSMGFRLCFQGEGLDFEYAGVQKLLLSIHMTFMIQLVIYCNFVHLGICMWLSVLATGK